MGAALQRVSGLKHQSVLFVGSQKEELADLRRIFNSLEWEVITAESVRDTLAYVRSHPVGVVITECDLRDGDWKQLLQDVQNMPSPPNVIVCSRLADDRLWSEVLNLGGYDVLPAPFDSTEVSRVADLAWRSWQRHGRKVLTA